MATSEGHVRLHPIRRLTPRLATAVICGIMVTGCATLPGSPHATPVSPEAYQTELRADGDALRAAVDGIGAAPPREPLASQVDSAAAAVRAAAQRLTTIVPPRHNTPPHRQISFPRSTSSHVNSPESVPRSSRRNCAPHHRSWPPSAPCPEPMRYGVPRRSSGLRELT
jgi:hypothetical protein